MKEELVNELPDEVIMNKIYIIRGHKVMLDKDLAELYSVQTKALKQAVKRNRERFPDHFMFELTESEASNLRSHFVTSSWGGSRYLPMAFTEHGVLMLSNVLKSKRAIGVSIKIIDVFVKLRKALSDYTELHLMIEDLRKSTDKNTKSIDIIFQCLDQLMEKDQTPEPRKLIGY